MNIYTDKCPYCGTYISIPDATICPGCLKQIYWGPGASNEYGRSNWNDYYYPSKESLDAQIKKTLI
jgi:hypothetical protein